MGFLGKALAVVLIMGILSAIGLLEWALLALGIYILCEVGYYVYLIITDRYDDYDDGRR